jgi:hypothetical protein
LKSLFLISKNRSKDTVAKLSQFLVDLGTGLEFRLSGFYDLGKHALANHLKLILEVVVVQLVQLPQRLSQLRVKVVLHAVVGPHYKQ